MVRMLNLALVLRTANSGLRIAQLPDNELMQQQIRTQRTARKEEFTDSVVVVEV